MRLSHAMASGAMLALMLTLHPQPSMAGELLSGVSTTVGGVTGGLTAGGGTGVTAQAGVGGSASISVGGTGDGNVKPGSLTTGTVSASLRASLSEDIRMRARLLGKSRLLRLCVAVGAQGCSGASQARQLALVNARLKFLTPRQLASACVAVGGSCGRNAIGGGNGGGGGSGNAGGGSALANADGGNGDHDMRLTCRSVLTSPVRYEKGLVKLCRKLLR